MPNPNYVYIGGGAYQPGSAAAKKAQELFDAMPKSPATAVPAYQAPAAFPNYAVGTGMGGGFRGGSAGAGGGTMNSSAGSAGVRSMGANLSPAPGTRGKGAFGLVPQVPNPADTAGGSIAGNLANLPDLTKLGTGTTKLNANLAALPYQANLPGYSGMLQQSSGNIASNLAGVIDPNEWQQLQQHMGERGASMGIAPDSPNFNTALMRALDQSVVGRQTLGQQELNNAIARTPTGQPFNTAGQQILPGDMQAAQYQSNVLGAAPDPAMAAQANLDMLLRSIEAGRLGGVQGTAPLNPPRVAPTAPGDRGGSGGGYTSPPAYAPGGPTRRMNPTAPGVVPPAQYPWGMTPTEDPYQFGSGTQDPGELPSWAGGLGDMGGDTMFTPIGGGFAGTYDFGTPDLGSDQLPGWAGGSDTSDLDELYAMLGI